MANVRYTTPTTKSRVLKASELTPPAVVSPALPTGDYSGQLDPETLAMLNMFAPQPQAPQMQGSPRGPFGIPGGVLDAAAYGAQNALQNQPYPRNFGQGLAGGFAAGLSGQRVAQAQGRSAANQAAVTDYGKAVDERRQMARQLGMGLAQHRWTMAREAEQAKQPKPLGESMADITDRPDLQALAAKRGAGLPALNASGRMIVPMSWIGPPTQAEQARQNIIPREDIQFYAEQAAAGQPPDYGIIRNFSPEDRLTYLHEWHRLSGNGYDAARARSLYKGLTSTTTVLQKQLGAAQAWGQLIDSNIATIRPIVQQIKDTGLNWANGPVRALAQQTGNVNQTQFKAMMTPLRNEIAKLVSTPGMTGVLTVEAQRDMKSVLGDNFTIPQLEGAFAILEKEKENRLNAYQGAINQNQAEIGTVPGSIAPTPPATPPPAPKFAPKPAQPGGFFDVNKPKQKGPR